MSTWNKIFHISFRNNVNFTEQIDLVYILEDFSVIVYLFVSTSHENVKQHIEKLVVLKAWKSVKGYFMRRCFGNRVYYTFISILCSSYECFSFSFSFSFSFLFSFLNFALVPLYLEKQFSRSWWKPHSRSWRADTENVAFVYEKRSELIM